MKHLRSFLCTLLAVCLVLPLFNACSADNPGTDGQTDILSAGSAGSAESGNILTNLFAETECLLPEEARVYDEVLPLYDRESGTITEFLLEWEEVTGEDNVIESVYTGWLYTLSDSGEILDKTEIPLPDEFQYLSGGAVLTDSVMYVCSSKVQDTVVYRCDRTSGELIASGSIQELIGNRGFSPTQYAVDAEGRFYGTDKNTVFVLNPDLTLAFKYDFPMTIYRMVRGADGKIWTAFNAGMESCAAVIDPETRALGEYYTFTRGMDGANKPTHYMLASSMNAGESAYNFFYYDAAGALWGVTVTEEGTLAESQVFDLFNSGISQLNSSAANESDIYPMAFLSDDLFLTWNNNGQGWNLRHDILGLHHRTDDIDMSKQTVLTIAYTYPLTAAIVGHITDFKRTRPNVTVVLEDYSQYAEEGNSRAGEEKLCFDLVNGLVKPDIIITDVRGYTLGDNRVMTQVVRNNLYVDLVPYLEKDDVLNFDNLFGCIRRLFDDGEGGMWGISPDFEVDIHFGSAVLLGDYADQDTWNLTEMLDFLESLPADVEKVYNYNRIQFERLAQGYGYFIKDGTASFDSEEFIRYLEYLKTVPADPAEYDQTSPVAEIQDVPISRRDAAIREAMNLGKIALDSTSLTYRYAYDILFSEETIPIGYATNSDSGFRVNADTSYIITIHAEDPDLCFELIKTFFALEYEYIDQYSFRMPLFARKDHFYPTIVKESTPSEVQLMSEEDYRAYCRELGIPASPRAKAPTQVTEEQIAELYEMFDNMGSPIMEKTPTAVDDIVNEEMSVFFSGMGTAEDCARKIQSRVEIWLSEHE
ncbi:MAG: hypothetical protein E7579_07820 [Ruminococcaceae bacterium]|nr:hypothetical protein [Oscillospiraceae bacterium]